MGMAGGGDTGNYASKYPGFNNDNNLYPQVFILYVRAQRGEGGRE